MKNVLFIEPFYGGSHKQLIDTLIADIPENYDLITLSAKKWHWRARCSALTLSQLIPFDHKYKTLFCSSVLSLAELLGIRSDLQPLKKIIYFHENQLIYPKQKIKDRDFQFGYNQITTWYILINQLVLVYLFINNFNYSLSADIIIFNSYYNMNSFLQNINKFVKIMPDYRPKNIDTQIRVKSKVLYFPINFTQITIKNTKNYDKQLHIVWPHRWEFDKGSDDLFEILFKLKELNVQFKISIIGETFTDVPDIFSTAKEILKDNILHWGYITSKKEYYEVLNMAHIVLSTAKHEFYGVAVLEAVYCGCFPIVPNTLVYPEIYDKSCLYNNNVHAVNILKEFSVNVVKIHKLQTLLKSTINFSRYSFETLLPEYKKLLEIND